MKILRKRPVFFLVGYLSIVLVLSLFTQSSIAQEGYLSRQDAINIYNQLNWRIVAHNKIVNAKEGSWV